MNKRGLIKCTLILMTSIISLYFMFTSYIGMNVLPLLIALLLAVTIFMFYNMKKIKKNKFIYDVVLLLLMIFSIGISLFIICVTIACFISIQCSMESDSLFILIYPTLLFTMILLNFNDIFHKTNKVNDILVIIISILIILIHLRYYLDPNFAHKLMGNDWLNEYSYDYVTQNYVYFSIMYLLALIHYRVNKVS